MYHSFEADGVYHELWLSSSHQGYRLHLQNQVITPIAFTHSSDSSGVLTIADQSEPVRFAIEGDLIHLHVRGRTRIVRYNDPLRECACGHNETDALVARAPMPGFVVAITASPGQSVSAGMALMLIESMKLETVIRSPQDGIVDRIHVKEGDSFEHEAVLVTLSKEEGR
ncbi:acetyl-CoA carboxylase biotin carboxyl carrier protein subunit [Bradyrhizobium sp. NBAIM01]|uniref:biotin/lipoyl-containing protein n=1 Tax=Bradyrhizobium sp. NBAIM01 TaxID=2793818 RepID=UPI001CD3F332|nr:acetyl-CoA carboxylase biotin carboxyl carrier protein subunit [Bradyrhizobium sp. NBAIM01]